MKVSEGFSKADSQNLPKVDTMMLLQFMRENDTFNVAEIRGAKVLMSSRDAYVETSVGYVEVKRENSLCYIQGRVTPEHRVRTKMYTVTAIINEADDLITQVSCLDCAASAGGCKHSICFIMWLIKRTEEPSVTSVSCYWVKPKLADAVSQNKFILAKEIGKRKQSAQTLPPSLRLPAFLVECNKRKMTNSLITNYNGAISGLDEFTIFQLMLSFMSVCTGENRTFKNFKEFASLKITEEIVKKIEEETRGQAENVLWHTIKQGRVSASKIYEASKCKTDGVLVQSILGGYKVPETKAIKRGKNLEKEVLKELEKVLHLKINQCGFYLITPFVGASPDGICESENFTVEIKCPYSEQTLNNYIDKNNIITLKFKAQTQLQMRATNTKKALFCIADPKFEENKNIHHYWQYYDRLFVDKLLLEAEEFWKNYIYEKMLEVVKC